MRVALVSPYALDVPGGAQAHVQDLADHLRARGHRVLVLAPARAPIEAEGVVVVGRAVGVPYNGSVAPVCPDPRSVARIRAALRAFGPDVVHVHEPFAPSTSLFATLVSPAPVVATFHAFAASSWALALAAPALLPVRRRLAARIAVSRAAASFVGRYLPGGGWIVPNAVDVPSFREGPPAELPDGRRLLFVGRLHPRKGFGVAVRAFGLLAGDLPDLRLVVAGEGDERAAVTELPEEVRGRVLLLGAVSNEEKKPLYRAADLLLAPSLGGESFGMILVEAMAAGVPVVASDIPGYREVVRDGVEGLLVPPGDPAALAAAARLLLEDPERRAAMGAAGRRRAEAFSWDRVTGQIERVYGQVAATIAP